MSGDEKMEFKIYWEKQGKTRLCGLHCLNSLLQGPYFEKDMLDEISKDLDEQEKKLLGGENQEYDGKTNFSNYCYDGNYNIQVINNALNLFNVNLKQLKKEEMMSMITQENSNLEALVFNSTTHWFCIRKINNIWFNLNPTNPEPGPQIISDFYLALFLEDTWQYGFTHFQVLSLPKIQINQPLNNKNQYYIDYEVIKKNKPTKLNFGDTDDAQMEKAIAESLKNDCNQGVNEFNNIDSIQDSENIDNMLMKLSLNNDNYEIYDDLKTLIGNEPVLKEDKESNKDIVKIILNKGSSSYSRYFSSNDSAEKIFFYVKVELKLNDDSIILISKKNDSNYLNYTDIIGDIVEEGEENDLTKKLELYIEVL